MNKQCPHLKCENTFLYTDEEASNLKRPNHCPHCDSLLEEVPILDDDESMENVDEYEYEDEDDLDNLPFDDLDSGD